MTYKFALELSALQQNTRHTLTLDGHKILMIWHNDEVFALQSQCPHLKLPLTKGKITEECTIVCPFHKSEFHLKTGKSTCWSPWPPLLGKALGKLSKEQDLKIYSTKIENGHILVDVE